MTFVIKDGTGGGNTVKVNDNNALYTFSVTEGEAQAAAEKGDAYNINTGTVSISAESAVLYFKNNESRSFIIESIAIGLGSATVSSIPEIYIVRNPTSGTIVTGASNVDLNGNRNFGSSKTLTADVYKGASGNTFTDGDDLILFYQTANGRLFASINIELTKGDSLGIRIDPNLSSGSVNIYAALVGHLRDSDQ